MNIITICVIIKIAFCPNQAPRSWTERAYPQLIYYNKVEKGGHFAAWEQPQLFSEEAWPRCAWMSFGCAP